MKSPMSANTMLRRFSVASADADHPMQDLQGEWIVGEAVAGEACAVKAPAEV